MPREPGKCFGKIKPGKLYVDTTSYSFYPVKEEHKSRKLKQKKVKVKLSPEKNIAIQRVDVSNSSIIWKEDIRKEKTFTFRTIKNPEKVEGYKLDTLEIQVLSNRYPGGWIECLCEVSINEKLYQDIMDVLVAEGFAPASNDVPFTDGFREKLRTGLLSYQSHYNLGEGALSIETIEHMKIKVKYK